MRAALLPIFAGDNGRRPTNHLIGMWMRFYERWQGAVDSLVIDYNDMDHGEALTRLVTRTKADYVMFVEEDGIILNPKMVDFCFDLLETNQYDIVGSPRMSCSQEISDAAQQLWNLDYTGYGDKGSNFWPNFFFCKRDLLLATDLNFSSKQWEVGDSIPALGLHNIESPLVGDTMVWMSIQLRNLSSAIYEVPQYHLGPVDLDDYRNKTGLWATPIPWFHMGSLSGTFAHPETEMQSIEFERRAMWHELCGLDMSPIITKFNLNKDRIHQMKVAYRELCGLTEGSICI